MPHNTIAPAKGQTWRSTDFRRPRDIVLLSVSAKKIVYHNVRKECRSMSHDTLRNRFALVTGETAVPVQPQKQASNPRPPPDNRGYTPFGPVL